MASDTTARMDAVVEQHLRLVPEDCRREDIDFALRMAYLAGRLDGINFVRDTRMEAWRAAHVDVD